MHRQQAKAQQPAQTVRPMVSIPAKVAARHPDAPVIVPPRERGAE
jgi:hypothetical protein